MSQTPKWLYFPKNLEKENIRMGDANKKDTFESTVIFTPKVIDYGKLDLTSISALVSSAIEKVGEFLDVTEDGFERILTEAVSLEHSLKIFLPLKPPTINFSHSWSAGETLRGKFGTELIRSIKDVAAQKLVTKGLEALDTLSGRVVSTGLSQLGLYSYIPQRQYFSSTSPISLDFSWDLFPKNEDEAKTIKKIVKCFQFLSLPQTSKDLANSAIFFGKNPAIWMIQFDPNVQNLSWITNNLFIKNNTFPHMVCDSVDTGFGEGDFYTAFKDGFPNGIKLSLKFTQFFSMHSAQAVLGYDDIGKILKE